MNDAVGASAGTEFAKSRRYYKRDFWRDENLKFVQPHYRMQKVARLVRSIAQDKGCTLLDVGCGPATLRSLLPANIDYYGIDMAIHDPAPNLLEADIIKEPVRFGDRRFDIIVAQGVFEYLGGVQSQKFAEIAGLVNHGGTFLVSYWNYAHRNPNVYWAHNNVQPIEQFRADLERYFYIERSFPASHNWYHGAPSWKVNKLVNLHLNYTVPFVSEKLAVEYFLLCSPRSQ
jgi:cyclopropane fatty-acyl-phospholipid synthase-like methyltransferase